MKSAFISIVIILGISFVALSQSKNFIGGAIIGFYGVHINGEISDFYSQSQGKIWGNGGYSFGFNVKRNISKYTYGSLELRYSKKGSVYEFVTNYGTKAYESIRLDYIELPILIGFRLNLKRNYFFIETGLVYARLFHSKISVNDLNWWDTTEKSRGFSKNDFLWAANLKYPIIKNKKLLIGCRFTYSLKSIHRDYKLYNMTYGIEMYYLFNKKVKPILYIRKQGSC